mmetsp:Transcript_19852/g.45088  ORF Transcript_19852/g.45088 Transcript_19852/m.45088 type:complete len:203 (-) Transcript_19852:602-1210(-)
MSKSFIAKIVHAKERASTVRRDKRTKMEPTCHQEARDIPDSTDRPRRRRVVTPLPGRHSHESSPDHSLGPLRPHGGRRRNIVRTRPTVSETRVESNENTAVSDLDEEGTSHLDPEVEKEDLMYYCSSQSEGSSDSATSWPPSIATVLRPKGRLRSNGTALSYSSSSESSSPGRGSRRRYKSGPSHILGGNTLHLQRSVGRLV